MANFSSTCGTRSSHAGSREAARASVTCEIVPVLKMTSVHLQAVTLSPTIPSFPHYFVVTVSFWEISVGRGATNLEKETSRQTFDTAKL